MVKKLCIWFYLLYGTPDTKRLCFNLKMDDCHEQGVTLTCTGMIAITDENGINRSSQTPSDLQIRISPFSWICWIWMPEKYGDSCRFFWTNCARIPPLFCQGSMRLCAHLQILRITMSHNSLPVNRLNIDLATPCNETFQTEAPDSWLPCWSSASISWYLP